MRYEVSTLLLALATTVTGISAAQHQPGSAAASKTEAAIRALRDSQMVRVVVTGLGRREGRALEGTGGDLMLAREGESLRVRSATIDSLWVRGTALKRGAIVGGAAGGLAGLGLGVLVNQTLCGASDSGCANEDAKVLLTVGLGGLAGGALVGALIGSVIPKWQRRFP